MKTFIAVIISAYTNVFLFVPSLEYIEACTLSNTDFNAKAMCHLVEISVVESHVPDCLVSGVKWEAHTINYSDELDTKNWRLHKF